LSERIALNWSNTAALVRKLNDSFYHCVDIVSEEAVKTSGNKKRRYEIASYIVAVIGVLVVVVCITVTAIYYKPPTKL
jgi:hypothetical protein